MTKTRWRRRFWASYQKYMQKRSQKFSRLSWMSRLATFNQRKNTVNFFVNSQFFPILWCECLISNVAIKESIHKRLFKLMIKKQSIRISKLRFPGLMKMIFYLRQSHCKLRSLNVIASDNPCNEIFKNVLLLNVKINYGKHYFKKFTQNRK